MKDYVALGELMYQSANRLPELKVILSAFELPVHAVALNTGRVAASERMRAGNMDEALRLYERITAVAEE
ncbi:MAG: hypothetical protein ACREXR_02640, partial [Gammaproteobacteria bacterium]